MADAFNTQDTREVVDLFWQKMGGDWPTVLAFAADYFADGIEWSAVGTGVPGAGTLCGREAVLQFIGKIRGLFVPGQMQGQVLRTLVDGCWAAAETHVSAAMRDGRRYENRYAFFIQVMDRKVCAVREYFDTYYVNGLIGEHL